jgi:hypothetical protein
MILYAVAADYFIISAKTIKTLQADAFAKSRVAVKIRDDKIG